MGEVTIIVIDLAKNVFQLHGAAADGAAWFRRNLRDRFMSKHPLCTPSISWFAGHEPQPSAIVASDAQVFAAPGW